MLAPVSPKSLHCLSTSSPPHSPPSPLPSSKARLHLLAFWVAFQKVIGVLGQGVCSLLGHGSLAFWDLLRACACLTSSFLYMDTTPSSLFCFFYRSSCLAPLGQPRLPRRCFSSSHGFPTSLSMHGWRFRVANACREQSTSNTWSCFFFQIASA